MSYNALAVAQFEATSGLAEDRVINTFAFADSGENLTETVEDNIVTLLTAFYNTPNGSGDAVGEFIGQTISRTANIHKIKIYDLGDPVSLPMGSPVRTANLSLIAANSGTTQLPDDVAVALSFKADNTDVPEVVVDAGAPNGFRRPASRYRGKLYIGPLHSSASDQGSSSTPAFVATACRTALKDAAVALRDNALSFTTWCVWSRFDGLLRPVVSGFVDNAFDVQRRRGRKATTRTSW